MIRLNEFDWNGLVSMKLEGHCCKVEEEHQQAMENLRLIRHQPNTQERLHIRQP